MTPLERELTAMPLSRQVPHLVAMLAQGDRLAWDFMTAAHGKNWHRQEDFGGLVRSALEKLAARFTKEHKAI